MSAVVAVDIERARRLTERIRRVAQNVAEQVEELRTLVAEAKESEAHVVLGYASWTAYLSDLFGDEPLRLARDVRKELVAELHDQGMSTRAIAPIVGVNNATVHRDLAPVADATPAAPSWDLPAWAEPASDGAPVITPKPVAGLDGKTYTAQQAKTPQRKALTDSAKDAGYDIRKAADRLTRIREDDRFSRNKEEVASLLRGHLEYVAQVCQDLLSDFDQSRKD